MLKRAIKLIRKMTVALIGITVIIVGIILLVLPGPGILVVIAGLFILSLEFDRAEKYMNQLKAHFEKVKTKVKNKLDDEPNT